MYKLKGLAPKSEKKTNNLKNKINDNRTRSTGFIVLTMKKITFKFKKISD